MIGLIIKLSAVCLNILMPGSGPAFYRLFSNGYHYSSCADRTVFNLMLVTIDSISCRDPLF